jgi:lysozyme family protein
MATPINQSIVEYRRLAIQARVRPEWKEAAAQAAQDIIKSKVKYQLIEQGTGVPWWVVGGIHQMEASGDFSCHLANGDPLTDRTVQEPAGLPIDGEPPFTWEEGAIAALHQMGWVNSPLIDWEDPLECMAMCERYNGTGYLDHHPETLTPYLWSGTNNYYQGKYVADGKWDAFAVSKQVGLVAIWMAIGIKLIA